MTGIDLSALPDLEVVETVSHASIVSRQTATFKTQWNSVKAANPDVDLPPYDVEVLETDPVAVVNEAESTREMLLRARINDAARAQFLAFSSGTDLENLAAFYEVERLDGESDDRLKTRVVLAIQGRSTGGTKERYRFVAMTASVEVADAIAYTVGRSPVIHVAVFSTNADGVATPELLAVVDDALQADDVRMVNDTIVVESAVKTFVVIEADCWLLPSADAATLVRAKEALLSAWATAQGLGRDLTLDWWVSKLMIDGMYEVTPITPIVDVIAPPEEAIAITSVTLNFKGRRF